MLLPGLPVARAQKSITIKDAVSKAIRENPAVRAAALREESRMALRGSASALADLEISGGGEEIGHGNDAVYTLARVRQNIAPFASHGLRKRLTAEASVATAERKLTERETALGVSLDYIADYAASLRYHNALRFDSLYSGFAAAAEARYREKAISLTEYRAALSRSQAVKLTVQEALRDLGTAHINLSRWLAADTLYMAAGMDEPKLSAASTSPETHPRALLEKENINLSSAALSEMKSQLLPSLFVEAGTQKIGSRYGYWAWQAGISLPVAFGAGKAKVKAARLSQESARAAAEATLRSLSGRHATLLAQYDKYLRSTEYYRSTALPLSREQQRMAAESYREGSIGYLDFIQIMNDALDTEKNYIDTYTRLLGTQYELLYY